MSSKSLNEETKEVSGIIIAYKFALGILELLVGLGTLLFGEHVFNFYIKLQTSDFFDSPHDALIKFSTAIFPYIISHRISLSLFLIVLGVVKIISCIAYWRGKSWGRDLLIGLLLVFTPFDLYKLLTQATILESAYLILDVFIILALTSYNPKKYFSCWIRLIRISL